MQTRADAWLSLWRALMRQLGEFALWQMAGTSTRNIDRAMMGLLVPYQSRRLGRWLEGRWTLGRPNMGARFIGEPESAASANALCFHSPSLWTTDSSPVYATPTWSRRSKVQRNAS